MKPLSTLISECCDVESDVHSEGVGHGPSDSEGHAQRDSETGRGSS